MKDLLGDRMKGYEEAYYSKLDESLPIIVRIDGRSFSSFCKRFEKPYDSYLHSVLNLVVLDLCRSISDVQFAERHSDEISLLIIPKNVKKNVFFGGSVQKISSVSSSLATASFCRHMKNDLSQDEDWPCFDARCFTLPSDEVANYFVWRNKDATRNSVNMNASFFMSHAQRKGKTCEDLIGIMKNDFSFDWENLPNEKKAGFIAQRVTKVYKTVDPKSKDPFYERDEWVLSPAPCDCMKMKHLVLSKLI